MPIFFEKYFPDWKIFARAILFKCGMKIEKLVDFPIGAIQARECEFQIFYCL
jgi:hypothetical protein